MRRDEAENEVEDEAENDLCGELRTAIKSIREERRILSSKIDELNLTDDEKVATFNFIMYSSEENMKYWKEY